MGDIEAFIDHGFNDPSVFAKQFFDSPDFTTDMLRRILRTNVTGNKSELAGEVWRRLDKGDLEPATVLQHWVRRPRRWLSFRFGTPASTPTIGSAETLLTQFGEEGWHGPVPDPRSGGVWYIRTKKIFHHRIVGNETRLSSIRWAVMAFVSEGTIALCWNNFSFRPEGVIEETSRNPFWQYIPEMFSELESHLGGDKWNIPRLHRLVLYKLWDRFRNDPDHEWLHLRIRAEKYGVALSARSAGVTEIDASGLEALTKSLARSAAKGANVKDPELIKEMEAELLRALLREWGANSYAFKLDKIEDGDKPNKTVFKGHCYFGLRRNLRNQDRFQHIECYGESGGSRGALEFFLSNT